MENFVSYFHIVALTICLTKMGKKADVKNKNEDEKIGKLKLVFEFFISKVSYMTIYMKLWEGKNWHIFKSFFTYQDKSEN